MGHCSIFGSDTGSADDPVSLAAREGTLARATGRSACMNPYVGIETHREDLSGAQHAEWVSCCRAWWKGWDDEETRRRPHQQQRCGTVASFPKLSDSPLEWAASEAARSLVRSGRAFETAP